MNRVPITLKNLHHVKNFSTIQPPSIEKKVALRLRAAFNQLGGDIMGKTVMIVEDDADIREVLQMILESDGYSVLIAKNGEEGLRVVQAADTPPNLILLDLQMPIMSGQDFLRNLRAMNTVQLKNIPVVILSAARAEMASLQANDRLSKPVDVDRLLGVVEKYCDLAAS